MTNFDNFVSKIDFFGNKYKISIVFVPTSDLKNYSEDHKIFILCGSFKANAIELAFTKFLESLEDAVEDWRKLVQPVIFLMNAKR